MTTLNDAGKAGEKLKSSPARTRSPAYPSLDLEAAIEKARAIFKNEKRGIAPIEAIAAAWEQKVKNSSLLLWVSSLKKFGLLEEIEEGKGRMFKLTPSALRIILDEQEESPERLALIKQAALAPKIHAELWKRYDGELPSDISLRTHLLIDKAFNDSYVDGFIRQFKKTISFAKLSASDKIMVDGSSQNESDDAQDETKEPETAAKPSGGPISKMPPNATTVNLGPISLSGGSSTSAAISVLREFTVPLTSGMSVLRVPFPMSEDDFDLFIGTLQLWKKKLVRSLKPIPPTIPLPHDAMWINGDSNKPVKLVAVMGERDGELYYQSEDGTGIPASQLKF